MVRFKEVYLDSSVSTARVLGQEIALKDIHWEKAVASELLVAELLRALDRLRLVGRTPDAELAHLRGLAEEHLQEVTLIPVSSILLRRAGGPFPTPIKALDAIHLATALVYAEHIPDLVFLTHDRQLATAARLCGLRVYPEAV